MGDWKILVLGWCTLLHMVIDFLIGASGSSVAGWLGLSTIGELVARISGDGGGRGLVYSLAPLFGLIDRHCMICEKVLFLGVYR